MTLTTSDTAFQNAAWPSLEEASAGAAHCMGFAATERPMLAPQQPVPVTVSAQSILLVAAAKGRVDIVAPDGLLRVEAGEVALLAQPQQAVLVWTAGAHGAVVQLQRHSFQIFASRHFDAPRRIAAVDAVMQCDAAARDALIAQAGAIFPAKDADSKSPDEEARLHHALIAVIDRAGLVSEIFADVRSVRAAVTHIRAHPHGDCSLTALAAIAGVTERTLRERFRQCFGVSVKTFVQEIRLDWANERLSTAREGRSISQLAKAAGFTTAGTFSKSYQRRFGEHASQTRVNAVRNMVISDHK